MEGNTKTTLPEEDEDLEALRLAALQSLKKKSQLNNEIPLKNYFGGLKTTHFICSPKGKHKRGRFPRLIQGRTTRNGQFNNWNRNSNLITVPMLSEDQNTENISKEITENVSKLILPQDRYCKLEKLDEKSDMVMSKFDRYNDSDQSESDSEEETCKSDNEEKSGLKRSNSLEDLMAELENEIQGGSMKLKEEKLKPKIKKKRKISLNVECDDSKLVEPKSDTKKMNVLKESLRSEISEVKPVIEMNKVTSNSFSRQRKWLAKPRRPNPPSFVAQLVQHVPVVLPEIRPAVLPFPPPSVQNFTPYTPVSYDSGVYVSPALVFETPPPQIPPIHAAPHAVYERPLSPLVVTTEAFSTSTLAPLSPRSAAFVLENRAIIEKRKRRSYSRSPSPLRFRRSKSPKRSSLSPKRLLKSPKLRSQSPSPVRKVLPPRVNSPKKPASIHDRLGVKSSLSNTMIEVDNDKKKDRFSKPREEKKPELSPSSAALDPVLEARRKKFERNEITMKAGVIRLKAKEPPPEKTEKAVAANDDEQEEEEEKEMDEDALLEEGGDDALVLDHKIDVLFSDEETDSDNEGRFKMKQESNQKVVVLPFTKLMNGAKSDVKTDLKLPEDTKTESNGNKTGIVKNRYRSRSPLKSYGGGDNKKTIGRSGKKNGKKTLAPFPIDNRKIEIKIRNPAKYKKSDGMKGCDEKSASNRKVEISKKNEGEENEVDGAKENTEDAAISNLTEGDLRAQLSRKRAEKQKHPLPDVVPSRLLQNALQGVGFRKGKNNKNTDENTEGKLPIHLRLGAANSLEVFGRKSRKHKNKGSQEQV